ncbi:MAG TPA: cytochrome c maturation protein CcmE [Candidatus Limnocylindria bacterium]
MSVAPPAAVPAPRGGRRWGLLLAVAVVIGVIAWIAFSGIGNALVYYQTPTELLARGEAAIGQTIRLGGLVKNGTIQRTDDDLRFVLTDGNNELPVHAGIAALPPASFRENVGAVVEGRLSVTGTFEADQVIVKHDENYVAPSEGQLPSQVIDPGS